jgi:hypothetical protein
VTPQEITVGLSLITVAGATVNVYVGLRLAAMQAKMKADSAALEVVLMKQFVAWKDELLTMLNGKYVTATLVSEIRSGVAHDVDRIDKVLDRIERRCEERGCLLMQQHREQG